MNVLHICRTYFPDPPGGVQEAIRQICLAVAPYGVRSRVFALSPVPVPAIVERPEAKVVRERSFFALASCDIGGLASLKRYRELAEWADVVHFHFPWPFGDVYDLLVPVNKPKVMTYHSDIVRQKWLGALYKPLMFKTLKRMDAIVATSPAYVETSPVLSRIASQKVRVIPLGIEDCVMTDSDLPDAPEFLAKWGIHERDFVLSLGVLRYYKGLHTLIEAARQVEGLVVIAGSGPEESRLREQASCLGVKNVVFTRQVSEREKAILLKNCTGLVFPSHARSEAFGMVLVEASMYSKPLISCEIGTGTTFVNKDGVTGYVVPPESPDQLAKAVNYLFRNKKQTKMMGQAARKRYLERFSGAALGRAYADLYRQLCIL